MEFLVVEDCPEQKVNGYFDALHEKGYEFNYVLASTVVEAMGALCKKKDYDLIILDLGLPHGRDGNYYECGGIMVLEFILKNEIKIPIIVNSTTMVPGEANLMFDFEEKGIPYVHVPSISYGNNVMETFLKTRKFYEEDEE